MNRTIKMSVKSKVVLILWVAFIIFPLNVKADFVMPYINVIHTVKIEPRLPENQSLITLILSGDFPTPAYGLDGVPVLKQVGNTFTIDFLVRSPSDDGTGTIQVLVPFSYPMSIGRLDDGQYSVDINYFFDGILENTIHKTFEVPGIISVSPVNLLLL